MGAFRDMALSLRVAVPVLALWFVANRAVPADSPRLDTPGVATPGVATPGVATPAPTTPAGDAQSSPPRENFLSSLKQAFRQDFDHEVVRGHFDVGTPPDAHRYYCLVDAKTGKREPNGVSGQPAMRSDGMTGIKASAVSVYGCDSAEERGILVTSGYVLSGAAGRMTSQPPQSPQPQPARQPPVPAVADTSPQVDVAGVQLGMSLDEARAALKGKRLADYYESTATLGRADSANDGRQPLVGGRYVNMVAAWTAAPEGESYTVMFTPVPGRERVMAVIHTVAYSAANGIREAALQAGLVKKYGGFAAASDVPASPTWRIQRAGDVQVGDACDRRGIFGGAEAASVLSVANASRPNLALQTTPDEFRLQIERCGVAIVTEDHTMANGGAAHAERVVARFTVTAYSPAIAFAGATAAAQLMQSVGDAVTNVAASHTKDAAAPNL